MVVRSSEGGCVNISFLSIAVAGSKPYNLEASRVTSFITAHNLQLNRTRKASTPMNSPQCRKDFGYLVFFYSSSFAKHCFYKKKRPSNPVLPYGIVTMRHEISSNSVIRTAGPSPMICHSLKKNNLAYRTQKQYNFYSKKEHEKPCQV